MSLETRRKKYRRHVREVEPGVLAFFPSPLARHGYVVPDAVTEQRVHTYLARFESPLMPAGAITVLALVGLAPLLLDAPRLPELGGIVAIWLLVGFLVARHYALRRVTDGVARVTDKRSLWARLVALHTATAGDVARFVLSMLVLCTGIWLLVSTFMH